MLAGVCFCYNQIKPDSYVSYEKIEEEKKRIRLQSSIMKILKVK